MNTNKELNYMLFVQLEEDFKRTEIKSEFSRYDDIKNGNVEKVKENYEYISRALMQERNILMGMIAGLILLIVLSVGIFMLVKKLRLSKKEQAETAAIMEETLQEIKPAAFGDIQLSAREKEILDLLTKGYTTPQIAEGLGLSPETVKWYRKKLLVKFDVANTAELTSTAKDMGLI